MLQATEVLPQVPRVPAPWSLQGQAWIVLLHLPRQSPARTRFVPPSLQGTLVAPASLLMFVDYVAAPCGPYRELLFIPGLMRFPDGRRHASISRIVVSTWESVVNGRANWGIPKDRAEFEVVRGAERDVLSVADGGREFCRLDFESPRGPRLPLRTSWLPARWLTLAQTLEGRTYYYTPQATGSARPARLVNWQFDSARFPDLRDATVLGAVHVDHFDMTFPVARVDQGPSAAGQVPPGPG